MKFKPSIILPQYRVTQRVSGLGWVDLHLVSSPSCWAATIAHYRVTILGRDSQEKKFIEKIIEKLIEKLIEMEF